MAERTLANSATVTWDETVAGALKAHVAPPTIREVTAAGSITVVATDDIIAVNKTVGAATSVILGLAADRNGRKLTIFDKKGDADVNPITPVLSGAETINGDAATNYVISAPKNGLTLYPYSSGGWFTIP